MLIHRIAATHLICLPSPNKHQLVSKSLLPANFLVLANFELVCRECVLLFVAYLIVNQNVIYIGSILCAPFLEILGDLHQVARPRLAGSAVGGERFFQSLAYFIYFNF